MKMTQRHDVWDRRTRWKNGCNKANVQDHFHKLETLKISSPSVPCLEVIGKKSSWGTFTHNKGLYSKPQKVLMPATKANRGRSLVKCNSLPPIYSTGISTTSASIAKTCVPSLGVGCKEQPLEKKDNIVRMDRVLFSRQKQGCQLTATSQLICSGQGVFTEREPDPVQRQEILKTHVALGTAEPQGVEPSNLSANDKERTEDYSSVFKGRCAQPLSDSAIEMDSLSSQKKENKDGMTDSQDEEYYTDQRITAWIIKVNASLFSSSEADIIDQELEEQDVDTIKIIYGQD